ncbi:hypothetical protein GCM10009826_46330 [Humibacillus xanthopallidus]
MPLNAIAREAGVGQGVLYRHFPSRTDLALAVFSDNIDEIAQLAAEQTGPDAFLVLWDRIVGHLLESAAFVEALLDEDQRPEWAGAARLEALLGDALSRSQEAGLVDDKLTAGDVILLQRMLYGALVTAASREDARSSVVRVLELVDPRLAAVVSQR